jgi:large subunit ribosomal protein L19
MSLKITHKEVVFGIGDTIKVSMRIKEGDKERIQVFEGMVIAIKNRGENKSFTVRRVGAQRIGIERIFPLTSPFLEKISVEKAGTRGVRRAKLYFTRDKSPRVVDEIYSRSQAREKFKASKPKKAKK